MELHEVKTLMESIRNNMNKLIVGKEKVIDLILVSLFCSGHVLLDDVPGVGKTLLCKCLANSILCDFRRVQFTPDLLPSDLIGINYFNQKHFDFMFKKGPVFTNILLADEINRATPRTQSSLLECMEEKQVTIDGETKKLGKLFFVIATENPVESHGTFPLPEAQLDRFFMKLRMGYPDLQEERGILDRFQNKKDEPKITNICNADSIIEAQDSLDLVEVSSDIKNYIVSIIDRTRNHEKVLLGVSPRGTLALMKASKVMAVLNGRDYVIPDDVKYVAAPVLTHRMILKKTLIACSKTSEEEDVISDILKSVPVPLENNSNLKI